jgi:restriction system protein
MPRKNQSFIDDAFELAKISPIACLITTLALAAAFAIFQWVWNPGGMFGSLYPLVTGFVAIVGAVATVWGFIHHAGRQRTLDRQRSLDDLRALSWQQFEHLVSDAYQRQGYTRFDNGGRGDGGVDVILRKDGQLIAVQCKQWKIWNVGEPALRDFLGAMTSGKYDRGIFVTVGKYTAAAQKFAAKNQIELVDGDKLLALVKEVQPAAKVTLPPGDSSGGRAGDGGQSSSPTVESITPNCPRCSSPMVKRTAKRGDNAGSEFWGCSQYPSCRGTIRIGS